MELQVLGEMTGAFALPALLIAASAYFLGCFNGAVIISKYILRDDVRTHGSGNGGLTNFYRIFGGPLTFLVILCDVLKAVFALLLAGFITAHLLVNEAPVLLLVKYWAGLFCMLGHMFPCMFHFKGGKGVLSGGTIAILVDWRVALIVWSGFFILAVLTRYVSLGSVCAGTAFPFATWFVFHGITYFDAYAPAYTVLAAICGGLLVWGHRSNIQRLMSGTESKFSFRRKKPEEK